MRTSICSTVWFLYGFSGSYDYLDTWLLAERADFAPVSLLAPVFMLFVFNRFRFSAVGASFAMGYLEPPPRMPGGSLKLTGLPRASLSPIDLSSKPVVFKSRPPVYRIVDCAMGFLLGLGLRLGEVPPILIDLLADNSPKKSSSESERWAPYSAASFLSSTRCSSLARQSRILS